MLGEEMQRMRKRKQITQAQLGERLDPKYSRQSVIHWESGRHRIPDVVAAQVLDICLTTQAPEPVDNSTAEDKQALKAYKKMRADTFTHHAIIAMWHNDGFTPSAKAQDLIIASFPDIMERK